jgi:hypothetical protein
MTKAQEILKQIVESMPPAEKRYAVEIDTDIRVRVGQYYAIGYSREPYLLAQVAPRKCVLVALVGGNRWNEGIEVGDIYNITPHEFAQIQGNGVADRLSINV